jgi:hypothetical protein
LKTIEQVLARLNTTVSTAPTNKKDEIEKLLRKELKDKLNHLKVRIHLISHSSSYKLSFKFGVYEFLVFQQTAACNSVVFFLTITSRFSMAKRIYLSDQEHRVKVLRQDFG